MDDQLDRLGVQLSEARRLAKAGSIPRARLALLLVDNAAETLLRLSAATYLSHADMNASIVRSIERLTLQTPDSQALLKKHLPKVVSKTRRKKIDRDFNALTDYVFEHDDWPLDTEMATCIKILHRYRNDAYHKDKVRPDVINSAVVIYFYLVAHLLRHRESVVWLIDAPPPGVLELLGVEDLPDDGDLIRSHSSNRYGQLMADRILHDFIPDHTDISGALSNHMLGRLRGIDRNLKEIADFHDFPFRHPEFALRLVQCTEEEWHSNTPPDDFWARRNPITPATLTDWQKAAGELRRVTDALEALRTFADQEAAIVTFEERASELAMRVDQQIQHDIDLARGK
ncbi:hypothetical protein [Actinoplanes teichomyceticus]|nr:hypothetical protein [Actinoplanes teichomyceticus]GIF16746.1 hypothetical protein Ate01nite_67780 [Actinoplanes teichomyceticus]